MKKSSKATFFVVFALIIFLAVTSFFGISTTYGDTTTVYVKGANDIRWGIDIRGGVDVTFTPPAGFDATDAQMLAAESVIKQRLVTQNITDYEVYTDTTKDRIVVRFPWKDEAASKNPEKAIKELGDTALLTFREGNNQDSAGKPTGVTKDTIVIEGKDVKAANAVTNTQTSVPEVQLELTSEGARKFGEATTRLVGKPISIWMDDTMISDPVVQSAITGGIASISGSTAKPFTTQEATDLANKINGGALPFKLVTENYSSIAATLGVAAKDSMLLALLIAYILVCIFMICYYRVPGLIASIALLGQFAGFVIAVSGYLPFIPSFTLTLPGIAGIILSIGMGVDANVITSERVKEELRAGKTIEGAIDLGYERGFTAIFDGNITVVIVAIILMGSFGPSSSFWAKLLTPFMFMFGAATTGAIYSFGYTLLIGVIFNFLMGVTASRLMLRSISKFKGLRKPWMYGGAK